MVTNCLMSTSWVGWRWLRVKLHPWRVLVEAGFGLLYTRGPARIDVCNRCRLALAKIDLAKLCEFCSDLIF